MFYWGDQNGLMAFQLISMGKLFELQADCGMSSVMEQILLVSQGISLTQKKSRICESPAVLRF